MSNFQCSSCGMNNVDLGKRGYFTDKEINLAVCLQMALKMFGYAREDLTKEERAEIELVRATSERVIDSYNLKDVINEVEFTLEN